MRQQLGMAAALHGVAMIDHQDLLRSHDGGESMRDHDHRAVLHQHLDGLLHGALAFRVKCRRRLVQHHDGGILQQRPCDADALALAAR